MDQMAVPGPPHFSGWVPRDGSWRTSVLRGFCLDQHQPRRMSLMQERQRRRRTRPEAIFAIPKILVCQPWTAPSSLHFVLARPRLQPDQAQEDCRDKRCPRRTTGRHLPGHRESGYRAWTRHIWCESRVAQFLGEVTKRRPHHDPIVTQCIAMNPRSGQSGPREAGSHLTFSASELLAGFPVNSSPFR
jgi:hypothetical protein